MRYKALILMIILILIFSCGIVSSTQDFENNDLEIDEDYLNLEETNGEELEISEENTQNLENDYDENLKASEDDLLEEDINQDKLEAGSKTFSDVSSIISNTPTKGTAKIEGSYITNGDRIYITKEMTLDGGSKGATLDGKGKSGILQISGNNVVIKNIKFVNGNPKNDEDGECDGGAARILSKSVSFINCTFQNNCARDGFAVWGYDDYSGYYKTTKKISFKNCKFIKNFKIEKYRGQNKGYVVYAGTRYTLSFNKCTFQNNNDKYSCGCIHFWGENGVINNCIFNKNSCKDAYSGIITVSGKNTKIINSKFNGNKNDICIRENCLIQNCEFKNSKDVCIHMEQKYDLEGFDSLYRYPEKITINKCKFNNCKYGAIRIDYAYDYNSDSPTFKNKYEQVKITNCYFKSCAAPDGGAIYLSTNTKKSYSSKYTNIICKCTFIGNSAEQGGAINAENFYHPKGTRISNCIFDSNKLKTQKHPDGSSPSPKRGSAYQGNVHVANNFWGSDTHSVKELMDMNIVKYPSYYIKVKKMSSWVNLKLTKKGKTYKLTFKNNKGKVIKLPDYYVTIKQRSNGKLIAKNVLIKNGVGTFKSNRKLTINTINIYNHGKTLINKIKTKVKAPKITADYKKSKKFKIKIKEKYSKRVASKIKIKVKIFTGKKSKAYTLKTNKKGVAALNTKKFKRGSHKVVIQSANKNYYINAKSTISIK